MSELRDLLHFQHADLAAGIYEDQYISRFGSHFALRFTPQGRGVLPVGLGPINTNLPVFFAVSSDDQIWSLPLQYPRAFDQKTRCLEPFSPERTMTSVTLKSEADHPNLVISWEFCSPFYPQDKKLSSAPFFYITGKVTNNAPTSQDITIMGGLEDSAQTCYDTTWGIVKQRVRVAAAFRGPETKPGKLLHYELGLSMVEQSQGSQTSDRLRTSNESPTEMLTSCAKWQCLSKNATIKPGETWVVQFVLSCYLLDPGIVSYHGELCDFYYQSVFDNTQQVVEYARSQHTAIMERTTEFDRLFLESSLLQHMKDFIAWNYHIYQGSTWLLRRPNGQVFYTNYEGGTGYFSTIDVEYNLALFYAMFWPDLIKDQLGVWADTYAKGNRYRPHLSGPYHRIMPHDVGGGFIIDEQVYIPGPMPVEENSNFLLLCYLYYKYTGDRACIQQYEALCCELADYILDADTTGNGLPDIGTNNTLDCFDRILRDMPDQVFLSVKALTALLALVNLLQELSQGDKVKRYQAHAVKMRRTLEEEAWLGDHYALTISPDRPNGWDRPSPLTTNGLAYFLFTGHELPLDAKRLHTDLVLSAQEYTIWPSMGVWRDITGLYFGEVPTTCYRFRPDFKNDMYHRSFNAVSLLQAYAGLGVDVPQRRLVLTGGVDGRYPLPFLANWETGEIPWLIRKDGCVELVGMSVNVRIEGEGLRQYKDGGVARGQL